VDNFKQPGRMSGDRLFVKTKFPRRQTPANGIFFRLKATQLMLEKSVTSWM
jgi:hypothetical protein